MTIAAVWLFRSCLDRYDLSSHDEQYCTQNNVAETKPGQSDCAACLLTARRLDLNSLPEARQNWRQSNPNVNDEHSDPMEMGSIFWTPDICDWWRQQHEIFNVWLFSTGNCQLIGCDNDSGPESISTTRNWHNKHCDLHDPNVHDDDCTADNESAIEQLNDMVYPEWPK